MEMLVDDALDLKPRDLARVLGGLSLAIVEVGGHGYDGLADRFAQIFLRGLLQRLQNDGGDLGRSELASHGLYACIPVGAGDHGVGHLADLVGHFPVLASHETLDRVDGVLGVRHGLSLGQ